MLACNAGYASNVRLSEQVATLKVTIVSCHTFWFIGLG